MTKPVVFQFSGQGSQYRGMGWALYQAEPVFRETLDRLDAVAEAELGQSVVATVYDRSVSWYRPFDDVEVTHPAILMVELALADTLVHHGIEPHLLLGASLGEFTASVLAGVIDRDTCLTLLIRQARALREAAPGGMLAILADERLHQDVPVLREHTEIAARNYPGHFVVTGPQEALVTAERLLRARDVACQRIPVAFPFHSRLMDPGRPVFRSIMADVKLMQPQVPIVSCAAMGVIDSVTVDHLWRATREPIEFGATLARLEERGPCEYVDLGPSGTLHNFVRNCLPAGSASRSFSLLTLLGDDTQALAAVRAAVATHPRPSTPSQDGTMKVCGFPGQGSQARGMGKDLFDEFPEQTALADSVLGYSIRELCVEDPRRELKLTQFTQPALYVVSALRWLRRQREGAAPPDYLIGHSLGEYVALFAAGAFDFETGLRLVRRRGELMSQAGGGRMAAVLGHDLSQVEQTLADHHLEGLDIANHNAPSQFVLAGTVEDLERARPVFESQNARYVLLNVSAPFHSRYLRATAEEFEAYLAEFTLRDPAIPVIANVDARPYRPGEVARNLARQIASPVRWTETIRYLMGRGEFDFEELGPGTVLRKLVDRIRAEAEPLVVPDEAVAAPGAPVPATAAGPVDSTSDRDPTPEVEARVRPERETVTAGSPVLVSTPAVSAPRAESLGAASFRERHGLRYACLAGAMYGGVSGVEMLVRLGKAGGMGFLGTAGMSLDRVRAALEEVRAVLGPEGPYGANLLHQYANPEREMALVDLLLRENVGTVEAAGFLRITPALVRYRLRGGRVLAKVSSTDMATAFLEPPPPRIVRELVEQGHVSASDAERFGRLPLADDLCVEIGGWRDATGTLATVLPAVARLRDARAGTGPRIHVGAAGGIGTPEAAAAAFVLGAEFVMTGSINQCTPEADTSEAVKDLLEELDVHDVAFAPAADAFELGIRAQVVKRGVLLAAKATKLHELWRRHDRFEDVDEPTRRRVEEKYLYGSFDEVAGAEVDGKARMATAFRSYLERGFELARQGDTGKKVDYLVYCGPAMGAFNSWVSDTPLSSWRARHVDTVTQRLMSDTAALLGERLARIHAR